MFGNTELSDSENKQIFLAVQDFILKSERFTWLIRIKKVQGTIYDLNAFLKYISARFSTTSVGLLFTKTCFIVGISEVINILFETLWVRYLPDQFGDTD